MTKKFRALLASASLLAPLAVAGCGGNTITVGGHDLEVQETSFGQADYFCNDLVDGQFMVLMTSFALCDGVHKGQSSRQLFHTGDETNLRLILPATNLKKVPPQNVFQVKSTNCMDNNPNGAEATAIFSHASPGKADYDFNAIADSGTITLIYPNPGANEIKGSYDLHFGGDHVTGSFDALLCQGIAPPFGD